MALDEGEDVLSDCVLGDCVLGEDVLGDCVLGDSGDGVVGVFCDCVSGDGERGESEGALPSSSLSKVKLFSPRTTVRGAAGEERGVEFHMSPTPPSSTQLHLTIWLAGLQASYHSTISRISSIPGAWLAGLDNSQDKVSK